MEEKKRISSSQFSLFNDCSMQWKFKYLEKREPDENKEYLNTFFGKAFHSVMEELFIGKTENFNKDVPLTELIPHAKKIFKRELVQLYDEKINEGVTIRMPNRTHSFNSQLNDYIYTFQINFNKLMKSEFYKGYKEIIPEKEINIETRDYRITGIIDFLGIREDDTYDIMDFKTGRFFKLKKLEDDHQTLFYNFLCYSEFGRFPSSFSYLVSNRDNMTLEFYKITDGLNLESVDYFYKNIDEFSVKINDGNFVKRDPFQKDVLCVFCQYKKSCKES